MFVGTFTLRSRGIRYPFVTVIKYFFGERYLDGGDMLVNVCRRVNVVANKCRFYEETWSVFSSFIYPIAFPKIV